MNGGGRVRKKKTNNQGRVYFVEIASSVIYMEVVHIYITVAMVMKIQERF